ncbi:acyltransferase family protein [Mycobacterium sp. WMMD1722]|uniref:acyltransferase family protein n=1 Tax=Mycobacterium sp. WMMD1722 TaxID=3404117 RepID=UPI003BF60D5F
MSRRLEHAFDPKCNALNAWRLAMALGVILWHSWPLTGRELTIEPMHQLLRDGFVDGFFAMSGFLITWSWFRNPRLRDYFVARALRILPGLWVCLVVVAFVIAPVSVMLRGGSVSSLLATGAPLHYVLANSAVLVQQPGIAGTPAGVPWTGEWNGSLWTLSWEMLCYLLIAVLGVTGLLRRRWLIPSLFALAVCASAALPAASPFAETAPNDRSAIDADAISLFMQQAAARFAVMFFAGALLYQFRHVIPARWSLVALSAAILLGAAFLPNYRVLAALPLAYLLITSGALIRRRSMTLRTDLSYGVYIYAFPVQQLLVIIGLGGLSVVVFAGIAALATVPLAALSWFVVEKPALSLKARVLRRRQRVDDRQRQDADMPSS